MDTIAITLGYTFFVPLAIAIGYAVLDRLCDQHTDPDAGGGPQPLRGDAGELE